MLSCVNNRKLALFEAVLLVFATNQVNFIFSVRLLGDECALHPIGDYANFLWRLAAFNVNVGTPLCVFRWI